MKAFDLPFLDTLKWKGTAIGGSESTKTSGWDWLVNSIDNARVRSTLSQFPVHDRIRADPIQDVEVWLNGAIDDKEERRIDSGSMSDSSGDSSDASMNIPESESAHHVIDLDTWTGNGRDTRYSPAFTLPLILAALENSLSKCDVGRSDNDRDNEEESPNLKEFVILTQRLCEKGALSLALASLCSECTSLRKVAVATLCHVKKALDAKEAHNLTSWRERPQLAMIVDSAQRGLATRIAMRTDPNDPVPLVQVPKLPGPSAVFLARAALILAKPGDPMFGSMNRYFLRFDNGHGAFQDTNRIPAFVSLLCSSADEPGQARRERLWALQLLKDSFVEPYCYRLVESCHAPELILMSFENSCTNQENDQDETERILLLDTLTSLLKNGGQRAAHHLVGRLGLISWIRGQLVANDLLYLLPSVASRSSLLRLLLTSLEKAWLYLWVEDSDRCNLVMEARALINDVLSFYNETFDRSQIKLPDGNGLATTESLPVILSELLGVTVGILKDAGSSEDLKDLQLCSISLQAAARMLEAIPQDLLEPMVSSLCIIPFSISGDKCQGVASFCKYVLSLLATNGIDEDTRGIVLKRVTRLIALVEGQLDDNDETIKALLACRFQCMRSCRDSWFECMKEVVRKTADSTMSEAFRIGKAILDGTATSGTI